MKPMHEMRMVKTYETTCFLKYEIHIHSPAILRYLGSVQRIFRISFMFNTHFHLIHSLKTMFSIFRWILKTKMICDWGSDLFFRDVPATSLQSNIRLARSSSISSIIQTSHTLSVVNISILINLIEQHHS